MGEKKYRRIGTEARRDGEEEEKKPKQDDNNDNYRAS